MAISWALRIAWFILALLAIPAAWIALVPFAQAADVYWAPILYGTAVTVLEGTFCLGMIWKMNPLDMPRAFCWTQAIIISLSSYILTGACACLAWGTYTSVHHPRSLNGDRRLLAWRDVYLLPMVIYPLAAAGIFLWAVIKTEAVHPTASTHCDISSPQWPRVLGYAGAPLLVALPSFVLSTLTARRIFNVESHARRFRLDGEQPTSPADNFTPVPLTAKARRLAAMSSGSSRAHPPGLRIMTPTSPLNEKRSKLGSAEPYRAMNALPPPRSHPASATPLTPRSVSSYAFQPPLHFSSPAPPSPSPSLHTDDRSRANTPSPITFAPVPLPSQRSGLATRPLVPILQTYTPSFDPGQLDFSPKAISPDFAPVSPSRTRVSFDKTEVHRGFHLPRRASIDSPSEDGMPPRPSLELSPEYAFAKLETHPAPPPTQVPAYPPGGANLSTLRWLPRYARVAEEEEEEDDIATTVDSHAASRDRHRSASPLRLHFDAKQLEMPQSSARGPEAPLSPAAASIRSRVTDLVSSELASAVWHVVVFQACFIFIVVLAGLSTWTDLARSREPSAFGTQHVALVLVGWGPLFVFGHTIAVRRRIRSFFCGQWR